MPYICTKNNVYIGEHSCGNYHYGDQNKVRECCVKDALYWKEMVLKNAMTKHHPAYAMFTAAWNSLTNAEMEIVGELLYFGLDYGFVDEKDWAKSNLELGEYIKKRNLELWNKAIQDM